MYKVEGVKDGVQAAAHYKTAAEANETAARWIEEGYYITITLLKELPPITDNVVGLFEAAGRMAKQVKAEEAKDIFKQAEERNKANKERLAKERAKANRKIVRDFGLLK
jgi:hypothetical protein